MHEDYYDMGFIERLIRVLCRWTIVAFIYAVILVIIKVIAPHVQFVAITFIT